MKLQRALRRHHRDRLKKIRKDYWGGNASYSKRNLGFCINTACSCSCFMCGNQRKWWGESIQEKRQKLKHT